MKKIIGLSLISILSLAAFAQDSTTTTTKLNRKDSLQKNGMKNDSGMNSTNSTTYRDSMSSTSTTSAMVDSLKGTSDAAAANTQLQDSSKAGSTTNLNHNNHQSNASMSDSSSKSIGTDRVIMKDEKMYLVKKGDSSLLEKSYKLESGAIVSSTGNVKYPSGRIIQLKNGQFIELKKVSTTDSKKVVISKKTSNTKRGTN